MDKVVNAGVIGVGHMGQYHVGAYSEITGVNLVGVADMNKERAAPIAEKYRTEFYTDYRRMLGMLDVVSIAVPTVKHYEIAKVCLEAGIHCLVEKPICDNLKEAEELFEIAERNNVTLQVGHV